MTGAPRVILLVEDEHDLRAIIEELLFEEGFQVVAVADGALAWEWVLAGGQPALVLLDFFMPGLNGWDFLTRFRTRPALRDVPVVAMSGSEVTHPGLTASLRKPFEPPVLMALVRQLMLPR